MGLSSAALSLLLCLTLSVPALLVWGLARDLTALALRQNCAARGRRLGAGGRVVNLYDATAASQPKKERDGTGHRGPRGGRVASRRLP